MSIETVARRYSTALADVVVASGSSDAIKSELANWSVLFSSNPDLQTVFSNPSIIYANKEKVLDELIKKIKPQQVTANFLKILLKNGRITEIAEISERFDSVLQERSGVVKAEITSARELPDKERAEFQKELEKLTGKNVTINFSVDKEIIGGVVTRIGSTVYDSSVKTKLENLKAELIGAQ